MNKPESSAFAILFSNLLKARFPYLYISTWEEERALSVIGEVAQNAAMIKTPRKLHVWSVTNGLMSDGQPGKEETKAPLKALEIIEKHSAPAVFVLKDFHVYFGAQGRAPDNQVIRKIRDLAPVLKQSANPKNVVFLSPSFVLPNDLQKEVTIIDFDLPVFADIKRVLDEMIETNQQSGRIKIDLKNDEAERLAKAALGLTLQEAENAFARAMVEDGRFSIEDVEVVLDEKCQIIKKTEILEYVKTDLRMEDVGGLENLKRWLKKRENSWLDSAQAYGLPAPKGVLITGVPGCGKSLIAKAISAAWQLPLLRLDIGKIFSGLVGSSEENMRKAIKTAEAIAPCILWIDEIEKGFGAVGSSNDSGTSSRVFGSFLTWMQEKTKAVFVVATANNIQALPPEFLRKGRFDEIFFVDLPTRKERSDIFMLHMNRRLKGKAIIGDVQLTGEVMMRLSDQTEGFVGAEIEQVVVSGLFEAFSESRSVKIEDFERSVRNTVPLSVTQAEQIRAIREWANVRAVAATTLEQRAEYVQPPQKSQAATAADAREDIMASRGGRTVDF